MKKILILILVTIVGWNFPPVGFSSTSFLSDNSGSIRLILDEELKGPSLHGLEKLKVELNSLNFSVNNNDGKNLQESDYYIIAGLSGAGGAADMNLKVLNIKVPDAPESLVIQRTEYNNKPALILCGSDETGLMYALLEVAQRISRSDPGDDLFHHVINLNEKPYMLDRSISSYTMQRKNFEKFLHDEKHIEKFFDMLAMSRINSYALIFGYENGGFMAPAYPYFFDVEEFPEVKMVGLSREQQARNLEAFKKLIELGNQRGIKVVPGFWDHIYRGRVQSGGVIGAPEKGDSKTPHLVVGVTKDNLAEYNKAAITKFLKLFPEIDRIQFRMHWESGLTREETPGFWHDMLTVIKDARPDIQLDLRAKGLPDVVIDDAVEQNIDFRITTKYWMEQLGLPFHPTHINTQNQEDRRHGYADLLKYPVRYPIQWRIWSGGTARFLLWGDPEYVRRFVESAQIYEGRGFEVNEMLATKMLGEDHDAEPFNLLKPDYRYYEYEFERYWHYYQVWGRVSYNPDTPSSTWEKEFAMRFGKEAGKSLMDGLHIASWVLPRIVACSYPYRHFPTTRGWAEMHRQYDLPEYAKSEGSDIQQFMNMEEYAQMLLDGSVTAKRTPLESSEWFSETSDEILIKVNEAKNAGDAMKANEFISTITDLQILAHLAKYHSYRLLAGTRYNLFLKTENPAELDEAIRLEELARDAWSDIVKTANDIYNDQIIFGVHDKGFPRNYREELDKLDEGLKELRKMRKKAKSNANQDELISLQPDQNSERKNPEVWIERVETATPGKDLVIHARVSDNSDVKWVRLRYRHLTQFEDYKTTEMKPDSVRGIYSAQIPADFIIPEWDLMYFIEAVDVNGNGIMIPDMAEEMPYVVVKVKR